MEHFVDKIIETDKKARQIIEIAQKEREKIRQKAIEDANRDLKLRKAAQERKMKVQDVELMEMESEEMNRVDSEYISSKHKMDKQFNASVDTWQEEIVKATVEIK